MREMVSVLSNNLVCVEECKVHDPANYNTNTESWRNYACYTFKVKELTHKDKVIEIQR